jgi:hypothetical protein
VEEDLFDGVIRQFRRRRRHGYATTVEAGGEGLVKGLVWVGRMAMRYTTWFGSTSFRAAMWDPNGSDC